jgi:hypothetical protein
MLLRYTATSPVPAIAHPLRLHTNVKDSLARGFQATSISMIGYFDNTKAWLISRVDPFDAYLSEVFSKER